MTKVFVKNRYVDIDVSNLRSPIREENRNHFLENYPLIKKRSGSTSLSSWLQRKMDKVGLIRDLMKYCEATKHSPQQLYDLNEEFGDTFAEELLEAFQAEADRVHGEGFSQIFSTTTSVKSFYKYFGKLLSRGRGTYQYQRVHEKADFDKEDLIPFTDNQPHQFKAMVATLSSVPARIACLLQMKWRDVKEIFDDDIDLPLVIIPYQYQKKSIRDLKINQSSFIHSWARKCLLEWRTKYFEITGKKIDITDSKSLENPLWITNQKPFKKPIPATVDRWFRKRSEEYGKRITPHSFRSFFNTVIRCNIDLKSIFMAQSGRYNGAYVHNGSVLVRQLREVFKESTVDLNPLSDNKFKEVRQKLKNWLSGYSVPEEEISFYARNLTLGLMQMNQLLEKEQKTFILKYFNQVENKLQLKRENRFILEKKKQKKKKELTEEADFPFTRKSWKGIYKEDEENLEAKKKD